MAIYTFQQYRLDGDNRLLLRAGRVVSIAPKTLEILLVLVQAEGRLVTKADLLGAVWPDVFVEESNVSQNIFQLRRALERAEGVENPIQTVPRRGYLFTWPVETVCSSAPGDPEASEHAASLTPASHPTTSPAKTEHTGTPQFNDLPRPQQVFTAVHLLARWLITSKRRLEVVRGFSALF